MSLHHFGVKETRPIQTVLGQRTRTVMTAGVCQGRQLEMTVLYVIPQTTADRMRHILPLATTISMGEDQDREVPQSPNHIPELHPSILDPDSHHFPARII